MIYRQILYKHKNNAIRIDTHTTHDVKLLHNVHFIYVWQQLELIDYNSIEYCAFWGLL